MRFAETPDDVRARWGRRHTFSPFDNELYHRDLDAAESRLNDANRYRVLPHGRTRGRVDDSRRPDPEQFGWPLCERYRHALQWMKPYASMRAGIISINRTAGRRSA